jgi:hypothetical protein
MYVSPSAGDVHEGEFGEFPPVAGANGVAGRRASGDASATAAAPAPPPPARRCSVGSWMVARATRSAARSAAASASRSCVSTASSSRW